MLSENILLRDSRIEPEVRKAWGIGPDSPHFAVIEVRGKTIFSDKTFVLDLFERFHNSALAFWTAAGPDRYRLVADQLQRSSMLSNEYRTILPYSSTSIQVAVDTVYRLGQWEEWTIATFAMERAKEVLAVPSRQEILCQLVRKPSLVDFAVSFNFDNRSLYIFLMLPTRLDELSQIIASRRTSTA